VAFGLIVTSRTAVPIARRRGLFCTAVLGCVPGVGRQGPNPNYSDVRSKPNSHGALDAKVENDAVARQLASGHRYRPGRMARRLWRYLRPFSSPVPQTPSVAIINVNINVRRKRYALIHQSPGAKSPDVRNSKNLRWYCLCRFSQDECLSSNVVLTP
jgi:hypothetical protein